MGWTVLLESVPRIRLPQSAKGTLDEDKKNNSKTMRALVCVLPKSCAYFSEAVEASALNTAGRSWRRGDGVRH